MEKHKSDLAEAVLTALVAMCVAAVIIVAIIVVNKRDENKESRILETCSQSNDVVACLEAADEHL